MALALYGKLISKRDFIAVDLPNGFLARWEPWLQGSMSAAMHEFGQGWPQIFFTAPIWRFWFGSAVLGTQVLGVMMPSMDGVGRQFPLTLLATPPQGRIFRSLLHDPQAGWFEKAEDFLLATLDDGASYESTIQAMKAHDLPAAAMIPDLPEGVSELAGVKIAVGHPDADYAMPLSGLLAAQRAAQDETRTLWWTIGGEHYPPLAFEAAGLPPASLFAQMMRSRTPVTRAVPRPETPAPEMPAAPTGNLEPQAAVPATPAPVTVTRVQPVASESAAEDGLAGKVGEASIAPAGDAVVLPEPDGAARDAPEASPRKPDAKTAASGP